MAIIKAYRADTGEVVYIPEHYFDHPALGKPFRKTPSQKAKEADREAKAQAEAALQPLRQRDAAQPDAPAQSSESAASGSSTDTTTGAPRAAKKE